MNKVVLIGRFTRDPELTETKNGNQVVKFTLAVDGNYRREDVSFINCQAWNGTAKFINSYFRKGNKIGVVGEWKATNYQDKQGSNRIYNFCNVSEAEFVEPKKQSQKSEQQENTGSPWESMNNDYEFDDLDLPFDL